VVVVCRRLGRAVDDWWLWTSDARLLYSSATLSPHPPTTYPSPRRLARQSDFAKLDEMTACRRLRSQLSQNSKTGTAPGRTRQATDRGGKGINMTGRGVARGWQVGLREVAYTIRRLLTFVDVSRHTIVKIGVISIRWPS